MHQLALTIYLVVSVGANSVPRPHCGFPGTEAGLLEQLLCASESIRMRAEELAEGEIALNNEGRLVLKEESAQKPRTAAEILQRAEEVLREGAKVVEQFRRESQKTPKQ